MPLHDFRCDRCGTYRRDVFVPVSQRASSAEYDCGCGGRVCWLPKVGRMDALEPFRKFTAFVTQPDGSEKPVEIGSLSQMRRIEHQSEQRARDGEGQQMVWRDYSNDRSNFDQHAFAKDPSERPVKSSRVKVTPVEAEVGESIGYGPGVSDANTSALVSE